MLLFVFYTFEFKNMIRRYRYLPLASKVLLTMVDKKQSPRQASAVPYRRNEAGNLEFCLITSANRGDWIFPKGIVDPGETPPETALKEAHEEAGIAGHIEGKALGKYNYRKWGSKLQVTAYLMCVEDESESWDEDDFRQRCWQTPEEAWTIIERDHVRELLKLAVARLDGEDFDRLVDCEKQVCKAGGKNK